MNHAINLTHDGTLILRIPKGYEVDKVVVEEMGTENKVEYQPTRPTPSKALGALDCVSREDLTKGIETYFDDLPIAVHYDMLALAQTLPSVQPEIIRCKACKFYRECGCQRAFVYPEPEDFCSRAERRGEQDE